MSGPLDVLKLAKLLPKVSRLDMNHKDVARRIPELTEAANLLAQGKITPKQYDEIVRQFKPVTPYDFVPQPATPQDAARALDKNKRQMFGRSSNIQSGETTDLRLDIPAYQNHGVWVNSIHRKGQPTVYGSTSVVKNPTMHGAPEKAFRVATGEAQKGPWAVIRGEWDPLNEDEAVKKAIASFGDPDWRQAGYDPERHGYFYDRETMEPVLAGEEAIQIGPLVLVRKPKYGEKDTEKYAAGGRVNMSRNTDAEIKSIIAASKRATERPRSDAVTRAKPATEQQKSFDEYRMAQQEARERLLSELPSRAVSGAIPGAVGALAGYGAQIPGGFGDLANLYQSFKPESFGNLPAGVQALPTTEDIQDLLREYINDSPEFSAGMTGGNAVALAQGAAALPGMVKGVAKGTPKVLGNLIDEILAPRVGAAGQRGSVGVRGKVPPGELAHKLAQERAALPVDQGGLGLPKDNTSEQRAEAMGFTGEGYHGSLYDIKKFNPNKASTEGFAARGTYITDSPEDASLNYADIFGPDVKGKVERGMELLADDRNSIARIGRRFQDEVLTPRQQEILLANTTDADNLGVVYPLRYRSEKPVHLDRPQEKEVNLGPFERYDEANDVYVDTPHTGKFENALQEFSDYGGETNPIREFASEYGDEGVTADALYRAVQKQAAKDWLSDPDSGDLVSSGVAAGDFLRHFGVDEIAHTPDFRNQQLNIGTKHTVAMNPENIRSRFAAFDPFRKSAAIAAAMGVAAPDLMAKEKKRGGAVSQDVMNMAVMNQKVQKRGAGGVMRGVNALMNTARTYEEAKRLYDIAKLSRSRPAQEAAGLYHPIGGGLKLSKPVEMMRFETVKDPTVKGVDRRIITAEDLQGGVGIPLIGDRAAAGRLLTSVEGKQFANPLPLEGGGEYMLTHTIPGSPESSVWSSGLGVITGLQNQTKSVRDSGKPIYGVNIVGAPTNVNFNTMVTEAILNQYDPTSITKKAKKEFLKDIRSYVPDASKPHLKPGANLTEADLNDVEALRAKMLAPGAGPLRKAFVERLDKSPFQAAGFPDVAAARLATTEPSLLDVPTGTAGFTIGEIDPAARALEKTPRGHRTYPIALGGEYYGSLDKPVDFRDIFQGFSDKRRLFGNPEASDLRSFSLSPQVQEFDQEWLDRYMKLQGANNPREFKKGGVVQKKADGGLTSDDLVLEERML